jgi:ATP synthase subunit 6
MLFSPLEQFLLLPLLPVCRHFALTNSSVILTLLFIFLTVFWVALTSLSKNKKALLVIPNNWQLALEFFFKLVQSIVSENLKDKTGRKYFPLVFSTFFFVLFLNLLGLIPYSFTITSHIIFTLILSVSIFLGINIIAVKKHGLKFFALFLPSGTSVALSFLLIPIEILSYIFKPISLSIRLFANMMAGHTLLKVIAGFSSQMIATKVPTLVVASYVPLLILIPLFGLELAVALIQSFVYAVLVCIYINDSISINH